MAEVKVDGIKVLIRTVIEHRISLEKHFGRDNLMGKCIISSDSLRKELQRRGFVVEPVQTWVLYEYFENCNDSCYEEHWLNKVKIGNKIYYIDCTMDQFQWAFQSHKLPRVYVGRTLPNWMLRNEPSKRVLNLCGWTDWWEIGDYENNFEYWRYLQEPRNLELWARFKNIKLY